MEVYFKELISEDASLEKIIDDLEAGGARRGSFCQIHWRGPGGTSSLTEIAQRLRNLKENCERISEEIIFRAQATDRAVRKNPYSFIGAAVVVGMVVGVRLGTRRQAIS